jgi:hypothetical protein
MKSKKAKPAVKTVADLSVAELRDLVATQTSIINAAKAEVDTIQQELRSRFEARLTEYLAQADKQHGQHTFEVDGVKLTAEVKATVKWDSTALEGIASKMPWPEAQRLFKIDFSVPEKNYNAIRDEKLLDQLIDARTVKYSEPKIIFAS